MDYYFASSNKNKLIEVGDLAYKLNINLLPLPKGLPETNEPHFTYIENALHKARHYAKILNAPVIAEDSGLSVASIQGAPGVLSARYYDLFTLEEKQSIVNFNKLPPSKQNLHLLLNALSDTLCRKAFYVCYAVAIRQANDPIPTVSQGFLYGEIAKKILGGEGFGYDPVFYLPKLGKTVAELTKNEKQAISHRGIAFRRLFDLLKERQLT